MPKKTLSKGQKKPVSRFLGLLGLGKKKQLPPGQKELVSSLLGLKYRAMKLKGRKKPVFTEYRLEDGSILGLLPNRSKFLDPLRNMKNSTVLEVRDSGFRKLFFREFMIGGSPIVLVFKELRAKNSFRNRFSHDTFREQSG